MFVRLLSRSAAADTDVAPIMLLLSEFLILAGFLNTMIYDSVCSKGRHADS